MTQDEYLSLKWADGVESYSDVYQRIRTWTRSVLFNSVMHEGPVLVVSHGGVLRAILSRLNYRPGSRWEVTNCAFLKLRMHADGQMTVMGSEGVNLLQVNEAL